MIVIALLIGISLFIAILFLIAFVWSLYSGQYDDTYGPSVRVLFDDKPNENTTKATPPGESSKESIPDKTHVLY